jgi:hypothetical protein
MPVPILPTPARPVDDAIIDTPWGTWVHDCILALPHGVLGLATNPANQTGISSSGAMLTGLTVAVNLTEPRVLQVATRFRFQASAWTANAFAQVFTIFYASGVEFARNQETYNGPSATAVQGSPDLMMVRTFAAGAHSFQVFVLTSTAASVLSVISDATSPSVLSVVDLGRPPA